VKEASAAEATKTRADALNELKAGKASVEKAA
jgi:hypothetical protein